MLRAFPFRGRPGGSSPWVDIGRGTRRGRGSGCGDRRIELRGAADADAPAQVDQIVAFVAATRGHQFLTTPEVRSLSDAAFRADILANLAAAEPDIDRDQVVFGALGWIDPTAGLFDLYQIAYGGGVVGYYDPLTKVLKVRGTDLTPTGVR